MGKNFHGEHDMRLLLCYPLPPSGIGSISNAPLLIDLERWQFAASI
jgi:hypothetical protein